MVEEAIFRIVTFNYSRSSACISFSRFSTVSFPLPAGHRNKKIGSAFQVSPLLEGILSSIQVNFVITAITVR